MRLPDPTCARPQVLRSIALASAMLVTTPAALAQDELDVPPAVSLRDETSFKRTAKSDREARELFERGRQAWTEGRFQEAWEHWHRSYRLSRRPALLYNVGQAADRLRMDREALEAFRLYLEKNPEAHNRKEVETRIRILEREVERDGSGMSSRPDHLDEGLDDAQVSTLADEREDGEPSTFEEELAAAKEPEWDGGQPKRSGWYFRGAVGLGLWADGVTDTAGQGGSVSSGAFVLEGKVGYGVAEQFVIGGGVLIDVALAPKYAVDGGTGQDVEGMSLGLLLGFADYYLDPGKDGFRLFGGLGFGRLALSGAQFTNADAGGAALMIGGGYEVPFEREIAIGVDLRVLVGRFSADLYDHTLFAPAITATAVWY